jgi:hypothetical protein
LTSFLDVKGLHNDGTEVTVPFDGAEQTLTFKRDCSTSELSLIEETTLLDDDYGNIVRRQGETFELRWGNEQLSGLWPDGITDATAVDTCFEGTLLWTIEKLGGPDADDST